jgi:hypothetical protein
MRETGDDIFHCCVFQILLIRRTGVPLMMQGRKKEVRTGVISCFLTVFLGYSLGFKFLSMTNELHLDRF